MTFLARIFEQIGKRAGKPVIQEVRNGELRAATGSEFLKLVQQAETFFLARGLKPGDRCALIAGEQHTVGGGGPGDDGGGADRGSDVHPASPF